jgi:hypothetical protein
VLVVAAAAPGSDLARVLLQDPGQDLAGRVCRAAADPAMGYTERVSLAGELPGLPAAGVERIARRTRTFTEVFQVAAGGRLAELAPDAGTGAVVAVVDAVADAALVRDAPTPLAVALAWAGGVLVAAQAAAAVQILGGGQPVPDRRVAQSGGLVRLAAPADPRTAEQVTALPARTRQELAAAVLAQAVTVTADQDAGLIERVVARQAAHRVRADLASIAGVQVALIRGLEQLGDPAAAADVADSALAELPAAGRAVNFGRPCWPPRCGLPPPGPGPVRKTRLSVRR